MPTERTLAMIKPDAVRRQLIGAIIQQLEAAGFTIRAMKMVWLRPEEAQIFYSVHRGKPFFDSLIQYITSGPVVALVLERENAITELRNLMGATNPAEAQPGTIRHQYGLSIEQNAIHGSDSPENAQREIAFFFGEREIYTY